MAWARRSGSRLRRRWSVPRDLRGSRARSLRAHSSGDTRRARAQTVARTGAAKSTARRCCRLLSVESVGGAVETGSPSFSASCRANTGDSRCLRRRVRHDLTLPICERAEIAAIGRAAFQHHCVPVERGARSDLIRGDVDRSTVGDFGLNRSALLPCDRGDRSTCTSTCRTSRPAAAPDEFCARSAGSVGSPSRRCERPIHRRKGRRSNAVFRTERCRPPRTRPILDENRHAVPLSHLLPIRIAARAARPLPRPLFSLRRGSHLNVHLRDRRADTARAKSATVRHRPAQLRPRPRPHPGRARLPARCHHPLARLRRLRCPDPALGEWTRSDVNALLYEARAFAKQTAATSSDEER